MDLSRVVDLADDGPMPVVRTNFSSDDAWQRVVAAVSSEWEGYLPNLRPISDTAFESLTPELLSGSWPREYHGYAFLVDDPLPSPLAGAFQFGGQVACWLAVGTLAGPHSKRDAIPL